MEKYRTVHAQTIAVYEAEAETWDRQRSRALIEQAWLDRFAAVLPPGGSVLDVGCGGGDPIARYFIERNFAVMGIDAAQAMIDIAQARFPTVNWQRMDMRSLNLNHQFDGIISWDSFFHLNPDEQRLTLKLFFAHLKSAGALLLTVGHEAGAVLGQVAGQRVYHSSLSSSEYRSILVKAGFNEIEFVPRDPQCGMRSVLLAYHR